MSTKKCLLASLFLSLAFSLLAADQNQNTRRFNFGTAAANQDPNKEERFFLLDDVLIQKNPNSPQPTFPESLPPQSYTRTMIEGFLAVTKDLNQQKFDADEDKKQQQEWENQDNDPKNDNH